MEQRGRSGGGGEDEEEDDAGETETEGDADEATNSVEYDPKQGGWGAQRDLAGNAAAGTATGLILVMQRRLLHIKQTDRQSNRGKGRRRIGDYRWQFPNIIIIIWRLIIGEKNERKREEEGIGVEIWWEGKEKRTRCGWSDVESCARNRKKKTEGG